MSYLLYAQFLVFSFGLFLLMCAVESENKKKNPIPPKYEGFVNPKNDVCPNVLIKKGDKYYLQNTKKVIVPGVNPIMFNNLDEYEEFIKWQKSQGINCPILFVEYAYNTQNDPVYFVHGNPRFPRVPSYVNV